ncbi:MAG TPA: glycerol-3-phosphate dehydrogenase C-terminal domain-containing protein, partial [Sphingobium sp.]
RPGGARPAGAFERLVASLIVGKPGWPPPLLRRLARAYGARTLAVLGNAARLEDLGELFGGDLTRKEIDYLVAEEWARTAEDILYRRSKLGLHLPSDAAERIERYLRTAR